MSWIHGRGSDSGVAATVETDGRAGVMQVMVGGGGGAATAPDDGLTPAVTSATGVEVRVRGLEGIHRRRL
jgi:hypothetical protein